MDLIQTITVGSGGSSSITFSNIPQTHTDLMVLVGVRIDSTAGTWIDAALQFNGSGSGYSGRFMYGQGSSVGAGVEGTATYIPVRLQSNSTTANTFGNTSIYIPNYASSNPKVTSYESIVENAVTISMQMIQVGLWNNTAAITSLTLSTSSFMQYSSASLYGVLKGTGGATSSSA